MQYLFSTQGLERESFLFKLQGQLVLESPHLCTMFLLSLRPLLLWAMTDSYERHDSCIRVTWRIHTCDTPHSGLMCGRTCRYVWYLVVMWLIPICDMTHSVCDMAHSLRMCYSYEWHDLFIWVTWLIHMSDMTYSYEWHDSCVLVIWLVDTCNMTHSYVWKYSSIRVIWLVHMRHDSCITVISHATWLVWYHSLISVTPLEFTCLAWLVLCFDMTCSYLWHDSFLCVDMCDVIRSYVWHNSCICVTWRIRMCDMTHPYLWHD